jgi:L-iditol 2-dehydrogenase
VKALVLRKAKAFELVDIPIPELKDDTEVLLRVEACGICGSDLRYWAGENPWALHTLGRSLPNPPNMVLGHEFSGTVVEVRSARYEHLLGQRVGAQAFRTCGTCALCTSGHENLCRNTIHIGHAQGWGAMDYYPGAYAEYCPAWGDLVYPLADHVSFAEEAMRDILGVAVHAVGRAHLDPGSSVACIGGGPLGLCIAQTARAKGAGRVLLSDPSPLAREVIARFAGLECLDPGATMLAARDGMGSVNVVFDTVGTDATTRDGVAVLDAPTNLSMAALGSERTLTTSSNALYRDEREAHRLIEDGTVDTERMITHRFVLDDYQEAYELLLAEPKRAYKVVFDTF